MTSTPTPLVTQYGLFIVFGFIVIEAVVSALRGDGVYRRRDTVANMMVGIGSNVMGRTIWSALAYAAYGFAYEATPLRVPMEHWWAWALVILAADVAWYWEHRAGHKMRLFWAVHSIHHSSERFNFSVAMRLPWLGGLVRIPFLMPLAFLGFPPVAVLTGFSVVFLYQIWVHTEYVGKIGWLEEVLNTPSHHRVHHASDAKYLDKNYAGILIVWDRLFGTFQREEETPKYGILHPIESHNPLVINFRDLIASFRAIGRARSPREALRIAFGDPAWEPGKNDQKVGGEAA